ncbi:hypothetical protein H6G27_00145 [Nostoc linckia FACHB-104]|nr:hypothetical protein [Nostoc linckia FACHB-104]
MSKWREIPRKRLARIEQTACEAEEEEYNYGLRSAKWIIIYNRFFINAVMYWYVIPILKKSATDT